MARSKRELGLLYRIRDLYHSTEWLFRMLRELERDPKFQAQFPAQYFELQAAIKSGARSLAIEEGKQLSDYEHFDITLNNLDNRPKGTTRTWPAKRDHSRS